MFERHRRDRPSQVISVAVTSTDGAVTACRPGGAEARRSLRRITSESVILQDRAELLLAVLRDERDLGDVAPALGQLIQRFVVLRATLKDCAGPELARDVGLVAAVLDHHVLLLDSALRFLASEWRSERLAEKLDGLDGLGPPARMLDGVWARLEAADPGA
jgi:hypothetical protein